MNNNIKNGLVGLAILGTAGGILGGVLYGVDKSIKGKKPELFVTDPQKADEALKQESDMSRVFYEASQNIDANKVSGVQNQSEEEKQHVDISGLCLGIAEYQRTSNEIIKNLKSGNRREAEFLMTTAECQEQNIRKALDDAGYGETATEMYIENLGKSFDDYVQKTKAEIASMK